MAQTFDEIWNGVFLEDAKNSTGDSVLDSLLSRTKDWIVQAKQAESAGNWQLHYELALELCRVSKEIRFAVAKKLETLTPEARLLVVECLESAIHAVEDADADEAAIELKGGKSLDEIVMNIKARLACMIDWSDDSPASF